MSTHDFIVFCWNTAALSGGACLLGGVHALPSVEGAAAQELTALRGALRNNTHLAELSAGGLPLPPPTAEALGELVAASASLASLCAGDAETGDESAAALAPGLARSRALLRLDLSNRALGPAGAAALARALASGGLPNGDGPAAGGRNPATLAAAAPGGAQPGLHTLVLAGNRGLGDAGAAALAPAALVLSELDLSGCGLGPGGAAALAGRAGGGVGAAAGPYGRLSVLRLGGNQLGPAGAAALAALVGGRGLRELHLPGCAIGDAGARRAALSAETRSQGGLPTRAALQAPPERCVGCGLHVQLARFCPLSWPMKMLHITGRIDPRVACAQHGVTALKRWAVPKCVPICSGQAPTIRTCPTALGIAGVTSLATCLTAASGLALLDVSECGIGAAGASALATALAAGAPLAALRARGNAFGAEGAAALADALARTATLEELDAGSNQARPAARDCACDVAAAAAVLGPMRPNASGS